MNKSFKTKLKITNKKQREHLKMLAGAYRAIFNAAIDTQQHILHFNQTIPTGTSLYYHFRNKCEQKFPFLKGLDRGILSAACFHASASFKRWWDNFDSSCEYMQPKHLAKKSNPRFKTDGNVRIFYDYIEVPKLGKIKLYEGGYLPQGKKYTNLTFSNDGNDWYLSLEVLDDEKNNEKLSNTSFVVDFDNKGNLVINGERTLDVTCFHSYQKELSKHRFLIKKLKRQKRANLVRTSNGAVKVRTSRGITKTRALLAGSEERMRNIRNDYFRKVANRVAIAKPKKLIVLSKEAIVKERQKGLSLPMRERHTLDFLNIISRKAEHTGTKVVRHKSCVRFANAASGSGVKVAYGEPFSNHSGCSNSSVKQELQCSREQMKTEKVNRNP